MSQVNAWIREYSASHGLHPDVAGYRAMGEALTGVIERGHTP